MYDNVEEQRFWNNEDSWLEQGEEWSEHFNGTENLWNDIIYPKISKYLKGNVLEIAPGCGRITKYLINHVDELSIVDLNEYAITQCEKRFGDNVKYFINDGISLDMIEDNSLDFVFSWDSFVHMHEDVINSYLKEIYRILKPNGYSFIHHSFLTGGHEKSFKNLSGRSNMTPERFKELSKFNSLEILQQENLNWTITDTLTTLHKKP
jgi:ubiquinone/menaquinone biosynthesis C-methylase UbiE